MFNRIDTMFEISPTGKIIYRGATGQPTQFVTVPKRMAIFASDLHSRHLTISDDSEFVYTDDLGSLAAYRYKSMSALDGFLRFDLELVRARDVIAGIEYDFQPLAIVVRPDKFVQVSGPFGFPSFSSFVTVPAPDLPCPACDVEYRPDDALGEYESGYTLNGCVPEDSESPNSPNREINVTVNLFLTGGTELAGQVKNAVQDGIEAESCVNECNEAPAPRHKLIVHYANRDNFVHEGTNLELSLVGGDLTFVCDDVIYRVPPGWHHYEFRQVDTRDGSPLRSTAHQRIIVPICEGPVFPDGCFTKEQINEAFGFLTGIKAA
jgi:hypothetical protein